MGAFNSKRIIPTRMGTSILVVRISPSTKDHPHAYGDKAKAPRNFISASGSSPRVWGQDLFSSCLLAIYRIIPTRMGTSGQNVHESIP